MTTPAIRPYSEHQLARWPWLASVDDGVVARFLAKVKEQVAPDASAVEGPCSIWQGAISKGGSRDPSHLLPYGSFRVDNRAVIRAHIFAALVLGTYRMIEHVPGWHVDHRCKVTLCVAPLHLEPVKALTNFKRRWFGIEGGE